MEEKRKKILFIAVYLLTIAIVLAYFEVQIEGPNGWASALPTWRVTSPNVTWIFGGRPVTGYHVALNALLLLFFHWPFMFKKWNFIDEVIIMCSFTLLAVIWDFLWFVINPNFGLDRYGVTSVWWFKRWFLGVPVDYFFGTISSLIIRCLPAFFKKEKLRSAFSSGIRLIGYTIIGVIIFVFLFSLLT